MATVYKNGAVNISAAGAADGSQGCFRTRESFLHPFKTIKPSDARDPEKLYLVLPNTLWLDNIERAGLQQRGWVLQERVFSPRTLHYAVEQVFWECRQFCACESVPFGLEPGLYDLGLGESHIKDLIPGLMVEGYPNKLEGEHMERTFWKRVVEKFSNCDLTYVTDKLVALSGIASEVQCFMKTEYLAGLWRSHLPYTLLWSARRGKAKRLSPGIAPSWSWASISGPVEYPEHREMAHMDEGGWPQPLIQILAASVTPTSAAN